MLVKIDFPILFGFLYITYFICGLSALSSIAPPFQALRLSNLGPSPPAFSPDGASILATGWERYDAKNNSGGK